ncbi:MAG: hypothetical protein HZA88_12750 [Verrucomicrobia bacterium]|nr:hypothetical protein [Verrucomicrobiota bacterium]
MFNPYDIVTLVYGAVGFVAGWLWGRHRSSIASFMASIIFGAAGFATGKALEWGTILAESWIDKLAQNHKVLGATTSVLANVIWFAAIILIPVIAIAVARKSDRHAAARLEEPPRRPTSYR